jgi:PST family polysaccharide transporter
MSSQSLDKAFAGGVAWTAGVKYLSQIFTWASLLLTARLLSPVEFGISEKAAIFTVVTSVLAEFGLATAVLQMRDLPERAVRQLHGASCLIGVGAWMLSMLAVPLLTSFFNLPGLGLLFAANNLSFLITGFQAVPMALLQRDLDYRRLSLIEASLVLVQSAVTVAAAFAGWSYWSLFAGAFAGKTCATILLWYWKPVPLAAIHWPEIRPALQMGSHIAVSRLAWSTYTQSDGIVIGRVLGDASMGSYRMAMNLASAPAEKTSMLLMRAAGPLFARVQSELDQVRRYFLILSEMLLLILLPLMLGLALVAEEAIPVILDPRWLPAIMPLRWLAVYMTLRPLGTLAEQVLISQRQTRFTMQMSVLSFCVLPAGFLVAALWKGPTAVAAAWLVLAPLTILPLFYKLLRTIHLPLRELLSALWPAVAACIPMVPAVWFLRAALLSQGRSLITVLACEVLVGGLVYGAVLLAFFRPRLQRYQRFASQLRGS